MTVINVPSHFAYAVSVKTKTSGEVASAFESFLTANQMKCFQTDEGKEYYNSAVEALLTKYGVKNYSAYRRRKLRLSDAST